MVNRTIRDEFVEFAKQYNNGLPIDAIEFIMEQRDLKQVDLVPYFGSRSRVSEVMNKKRPLTKNMIRRLMAGLGISAKVLIQEYELSQPKKEKDEHI